jgi:outer membrane protein
MPVIRNLTLGLVALFANAGHAATSDGPTVTLTLDHALELARANLPALRQARAQSAQARGIYDETRAAYYPTLSVALGYKRTTGNQIVAPGTNVSSDALPAPSFATYNSFTNSVSASQLLWDFGQTSHRVRASAETALSQSESERTALLQTELALRVAFFTAAAQRELVTVADVNLTNNETHLAEARAFVKEGRQPEIALVTAEATRANALVQAITAKNAYATAKTRLNQAMGVQGAITYEVRVEPMIVVPDEDAPLERLVLEAIGTRPEAASLEAQRRSAQASVDASRGAWFPSLSLGATATDSGTTLAANRWLGLTPNFSAGVALSWAANLGPAIPAQVRVALAQIANLDAQLDALQAQVRVDVGTAQLAVQAAREALTAAMQGRHAANTQLALANGRFAAGVGNAVEVSDAQLAADQSGAQEVQAQLNLDVARAQLIAALGRHT